MTKTPGGILVRNCEHKNCKKKKKKEKKKKKNKNKKNKKKKKKKNNNNTANSNCPGLRYVAVSLCVSMVSKAQERTLNSTSL